MERAGLSAAAVVKTAAARCFAMSVALASSPRMQAAVESASAISPRSATTVTERRVVRPSPVRGSMTWLKRWPLMSMNCSVSPEVEMAALARRRVADDDVSGESDAGGGEAS